MAPAYRNATTGQTVISDEPRPDLEALARWDEIPMPEPEPAPAPPVGLDIAANSSVASTTHTPGAAPATGDGDPVAPPVGDTVAPTPVDDGGPAKGTGDDTGDTGDGDGDETGDGDGDETRDGTDTGDNDPESAPVPDTSWTDEALDALAKERGITYRSNASKATKVAKLTAPAGE